MTPIIMTIINENSDKLSLEQKKDLKDAQNIFRAWEGKFEETSVAASLYIRFQIQFVRSLFVKQVGRVNEDQRMELLENYHFTDVFQRMLTSINEEKENSRFQTICEGYHEKYDGKNFCGHNIAMAMV